jgi:hypothetical protein
MIMTKLLLVATLAAGILLPATVPAQSFSIAIGDQPHYRHGPRYWAGDYEMIWVPGHRSGRYWVHGRYVRGENRRRHWDRRYDSRDQRDDRRDYRDDRRDNRY